MCQEAVRRLCSPSESGYVRKVARLLAQPLMRSPGGRFWVEARNACWSGFPLPALAGTGPAGMIIMGSNRVGVAPGQVLRRRNDPADSVLLTVLHEYVQE